MIDSSEEDQQHRPGPPGRVSPDFARLLRKYGASPRLMRKVRRVTRGGDSLPPSNDRNESAEFAKESVKKDLANLVEAISDARKEILAELHSRTSETSGHRLFTSGVRFRVSSSALLDASRRAVFQDVKWFVRPHDVRLPMIYQEPEPAWLQRLPGGRSGAVVFDAGDLALDPEAMQSAALTWGSLFGDQDALPLPANNYSYSFDEAKPGAEDVAGEVATLERLVAAMGNALGSAHPGTLIVRRFLGEAQGRAGDSSGAMVTLKRLVMDLAQILGSDHPETQNARMSLHKVESGVGQLPR